MTFNYTPAFIESGLTYAAYKQHVNDTLAQPPVDEEAAKLRGRMLENLHLMNEYDKSYSLSGELRNAIRECPPATWVVIAEGWCVDAAYNVPMIAAIEKAMPENVTLRIFLRDENAELIDANLTDGGRSIPKLIILDNELQEVACWGPRPEALHTRVKAWRADGLSMKQIFPKMHSWYDADASRTFQKELEQTLSTIPADKV